MKTVYQNRKIDGGANRTTTSPTKKASSKGTKVQFITSPARYKLAYMAGDMAVILDEKLVNKLIKEKIAKKC